MKITCSTCGRKIKAEDFQKHRLDEFWKFENIRKAVRSLDHGSLTAQEMQAWDNFTVGK